MCRNSHGPDGEFWDCSKQCSVHIPWTGGNFDPTFTNRKGLLGHNLKQILKPDLKKNVKIDPYQKLSQRIPHFERSDQPKTPNRRLNWAWITRSAFAPITVKRSGSLSRKQAFLQKRASNRATSSSFCFWKGFDKTLFRACMGSISG